MRSQYVTIYRFSLPQDADVVRLKLDEEGVRYFLENELLVQTDNFLSNSVGGVPLKVHPEDIDRAKDILIAGEILLPDDQINRTPDTLDLIALNLIDERSRWRTIAFIALGIGLLVSLLALILLKV